MFEKQRRKAKKAVNRYAALAAGTAIVTGPIPGTSVALTGIEAKMVYDVARIYGFHLSMQEAGALVVTLLAASTALKAVTTEASTFVPVIGWWVAKPTIGAGVCKAVGEAAIRYFENELQHETEEKVTSPKGGRGRAEVQRSITINAPVEKVFSYIDEPANLLEIWPSIVEIKDVERLTSGGTTFQWVYRMAGVRLEGTGETTDYTANQCIVIKTTGSIESTVTWTFRRKPGGVEVTFEAEYAVPAPVLDKVTEAFIVEQNEREAELILANLKAMMEA